MVARFAAASHVLIDHMPATWLPSGTPSRTNSRWMTGSDVYVKVIARYMTITPEPPAAA